MNNQLYSSYGRAKTKNFQVNPTSFKGSDWSSTHAREGLVKELEAYNAYGNQVVSNVPRPPSKSVHTNVYRVNGINTQITLNRLETREDITPSSKGSRSNFKSVKKPPKAPRAAQKGENLIGKFNDPTMGYVNTQIGTSAFYFNFIHFL